MDSTLTPPTLRFLTFTHNIFLQPIPEISWLFPTFGCGDPYEICFQEILFTPTDSTFETPSTKIFFSFFTLIKKSFYKP